MPKFRVHYETPADPGYWTEHTYSHEVTAPSLAEAAKVSSDQIVKAGQLQMTGFDLMDSFHGLDRDFYYLKDYPSEEKFREKLTSMLKRIEAI